MLYLSKLSSTNVRSTKLSLSLSGLNASRPNVHGMNLTKLNVRKLNYWQPLATTLAIALWYFTTVSTSAQVVAHANEVAPLVLFELSAGRNANEHAPTASLTPTTTIERPVGKVVEEQAGKADSELSFAPSANFLIGSRTVACQAASEWVAAKQLRKQAQAVQELHCESDDCTRQAANAIAVFLRQQAEHQQDIAAAVALRAYYAQAGISEQFGLLEKSVAALQLQRDRQAAILEKGIAVAVDLTSLDREAITQQLQRLQLENRNRQLTETINELTHVQYDWKSSVVEPLETRTQAIDVAYLKQFAITHRHDLLAIQCLGSQINNGTAPILASVISSATGMLNLPLPKKCFVARLLGREDNSLLTQNLNEAVAMAVETQSKAIQREVSEKAVSLELAYQRIELAQDTTATWQKRISQLERLEVLGDNRPGDLTLAQTSLLGARAVEIDRRLEAKLAEVALAEACGGLCYRCCNGRAWLVTAR